MDSWTELLDDVRACTICAEHLPDGVRPVLQLHPRARVLVAGQAHHLNDRRSTLTETVRDWRSYGSKLIPLPHPSPRNNIWLKRNSWFESGLLPTLRRRVSRALKK